nr:DUF4221 family protein [Roseivirga sp. E12]
MEVIDSLRISLPSDIRDPDYEVAVFWSYDDNGFSFLTEMEEPIMHLNRYDFKNETWSRHRLNRDGPNQVYSKGGFKIVGDSTMFYFPIVGNQIIELDRSAQVLSSHNFSPSGLENYNGLNKNPELLRINDQVYFDLTEYYSLRDKSTFKKSYLIGRFDLRKKRFEKMVRFPEEFHGTTWSTNDSDRSSVFAKGKIYMNFTKSPYVYEYNLQGELLNKKYVGTKKIRDAGTRSDSREINALRQQNNGYYHKLIYDKWRNVFYRIGVYFDTDREIKDMQDMVELASKRTLAILILNEDLELIGLTEFPIKTRISENYYFVNEDGLYLKYYGKGPSEEVLDFYRLGLADL